MRVGPADEGLQRASLSGGGYRDAESLFRSKPISEIRTAESTTRSLIQQKQDDLRRLVGTRYRDLIDSADSILIMKQSSLSISSNLSSIQLSLSSLSPHSHSHNHNPIPIPNDRNDSSSSSSSSSSSFNNEESQRSRIYAMACRVKYLVDAPEHIWGCLDESMFLEAASRFVRSKHVHLRLNADLNDSDRRRFGALLQHQWQIVDGFKAQISQRARDRLSDRDLPIGSYADAMASVSVIDDLSPERNLSLFLESRKAWISQTLLNRDSDDGQDVVRVFLEILRTIQVTVGQVGELFLRVLNELPLFYKVVLGSPPASQLFGGIPNPEEEVKLWNSFRDHLESAMVVLDKDCIAKACSSWVRECGREMVAKINGRFLIDAVGSGRELAAAEKAIRETMESKEVLGGSLEWLRSVFGGSSEIELPWSRMRELVLGDDSDLWDDILEDAFVGRMKAIVDSSFGEMASVVNAVGGEAVGGECELGFGGVWFIDSNAKKVSLSGLKAKHSPEESNEFKSCLSAYFGPQISGIRDAVDNCCQNVLDDVLSFLESPKASLRLKALAPYLQSKCYDSLSIILKQLKQDIHDLEEAATGGGQDKGGVQRAIFIGRLLFAFLNHSKHVPVVLGPPRFWVNETVSVVFDRLPLLLRADSLAFDGEARRASVGSKRHTSLATAALLGADESASPKLEELISTLRELCIRAHGLWISWLSNELSIILSRELEQDDALNSTAPLRGWEETVVKQDQSDDSHSEMTILLPSMPSLYIVSFLFRACEEVHRIGGHVLDRTILQKLALSLFERVVAVYGNFLSTKEASGPQMSEKGVLQVLLDLRFVADVLSGGDSNLIEESLKLPRAKVPFRRKQDSKHTKSLVGERVNGLITHLSQRLDPIDWLTYEPYLWENERQSYQRHAVLFGFFVQLNRLYTDTVQKLPTNSESNIMRCSSVPRFKYLPISAPALSSRGTTKASLSTSAEDISSRSSWKAYTNGDISDKIDMDDSSSFGVATPFLKSFMQVGSKFGGSTLKLGSILADGQVGIFKDRSTAAMSSFGDILPVQAAGLLSSFTASKSDS